MCIACGSSSTPEPDAATDALDASATESTFEWEPWPEGPVPYRVEFARCNHDAAEPGRCNAGFDCTGNVEVELVALTRAERVCVATDTITELTIERFEPYAPGAPLEVPVEVTLNGEPFEGAGTLRLVDATGAEAYAGALQHGMTLTLERGELRALVSVERDARNPAWTRGAHVTIGDGGLNIQLESGRVTLEGEGRARLHNRDTGVSLEVAIPATVPLVPGTYDVVLVREQGGAPQPELRVEAGTEQDVPLTTEIVRAEGEVRVDGAPVSVGRVVFFDPEIELEVQTDIADGRYSVDLVDRAWAVYLDTRDVDTGLPQMRALTHEAVRASDALDLDVSTVSLRGTYTVDGAPAPNLGTRFGFLQVVDALGIAGAGVIAQDGTFDGRVYASRASLVFIGTHATAPRLAQDVADAIVLDDVPIEIDIRTAMLEVLLRVDGGTFPVAPDIEPRGRGVVSIADETRRIDALLPPRGEAIASLVVPPGRYTLHYVNEGFAELPIGRHALGEIVVEGEERVELDLTLHELFVRLPIDAGRAHFTGVDDGSFVESEVSGAAPGMVKLFGGTWRLYDFCTTGCGRLVLGWFEL